MKAMLSVENIVKPVNWTQTLRYYYKLSKPTITMLVVVTTVPGVLLASTQFPSWQLWLAVLLGTALSSASAATFNQVIDSGIDEKMRRTQQRPLPQGQLDQRSALIYGCLTGVLGTGILCAVTTPLASGVALAANLFYVLVYTAFLKRRTVQNIVIGGAAGAVGPLIGWAAVTGDLGLPAWVLFALIFLWTPPHFWALSLKYKDDYAQAGIPMLPVVYGDEITRRDIFLYSLTLLVPSGLLFMFCEWPSAVFSLFLTIVFVGKAWKLYRQHNNDSAMPLFHYSCIYLFLIFGAIGVERWIRMLSHDV